MNNFQKVIEGGYCIGCGICAVNPSHAIEMKLDELGQYKPNYSYDSNITNFNEICPFSGESQNEDQIANALFKAENFEYTDALGYHYKIVAGYVQDDKRRLNSSSGGFITWLLEKLFDLDQIDGVVHVGDFKNDDEVIMGYRISFSKEEINQNTKSRYYPIESSKVLTEIKQKYPDKRFVFIGIPCFIKGLRLLQQNDASYKDLIVYTFGIVCGHLKTTGFAENYAWQKGIIPDNLKQIDFRVFDQQNTSAIDYSVKMTGILDNKTVSITEKNSKLLGSNWGLGLFKNNACEYCDDVMAETADITFGDAWLPQYAKDTKGTNIVVFRNKKLYHLFQEFNTEIYCDELTPQDAIKSQDAGIRHRRQGLSYRLYLQQKQGRWFPKKRIEPNNINDKKYRKIFAARTILSQNSLLAFKEAKQKKSYQLFTDKIQPQIDNYQSIYHPKPTFSRKVINKIKFELNKRGF